MLQGRHSAILSTFIKVTKLPLRSLFYLFFSGRLRQVLLYLALLYVIFSCVFVTFPYEVLGHLWFLIVSIPEFCIHYFFNNKRSKGMICLQYTPDALGCLSFQASGSVVVHSLFNVPPIICWESAFCLCFFVYYLVSSPVLLSS